MPDYLGDDQRRVKSDPEDGDKIKCEPNAALNLSSERGCFIFYLMRTRSFGRGRHTATKGLCKSVKRPSEDQCGLSPYLPLTLSLYNNISLINIR